ncbi:MAG TPA: fasciclin domain-containing protein [Terriglobales bacterium]|nr:fasciclin domain-containing protein [Terriglobales bacterium]
MNKKLAVLIALVAIAVTSAVAGMKNPTVGGQEMYPTKNIVENAVNSADHTTLVAAVKAAGLVETLESPGPFTVFAPTNEAFAKLPAGTVDTLLKPENKAMLTKVLTYHVVSGRLSASDLKKQIKAGNGTAELTTVEGGKLWASLQDGNHIVLKDEKGGTAIVTIPNVFQSNGVIHVIDSVVLPN